MESNTTGEKDEISRKIARARDEKVIVVLRTRDPWVHFPKQFFSFSPLATFRDVQLVYWLCT